MSKLRVANFSVSIDGFAAGPNQSLDNPLGEGGQALFSWAFATESFKKMQGQSGGSTEIDNDFMNRGFENIGAWILGRNMFGPIRGSWLDDEWKGWWGDEPPYHTPVFVLSHHPREPLEMKGGTVFHFVTGGIHEALKRAKQAANGKDVRLGGGTATIREYIRAGLVDEIHLAISPALLGSGEHLLADINLPSLGFQCVEHVASEQAMHVVMRKN